MLKLDGQGPRWVNLTRNFFFWGGNLVTLFLLQQVPVFEQLRYRLPHRTFLYLYKTFFVLKNLVQVWMNFCASFVKSYFLVCLFIYLFVCFCLVCLFICLFVFVQKCWSRQVHGPGNYFSEFPDVSLGEINPFARHPALKIWRICRHLFSY